MPSSMRLLPPEMHRRKYKQPRTEYTLAYERFSEAHPYISKMVKPAGVLLVAGALTTAFYTCQPQDDEQRIDQANSELSDMVDE